MHPDQIALVQQSFAQVLPIADTAASLFYGQLFALDPALRPLFGSDMAEQRQKLMAMLQVAVQGLSAPARLLPALQRLGERHAGYGVRADHYDTVGAALLWTLGAGLGAAFTPEVEAAWAAAYALIAETMQTAAVHA